ncbi:glycosyltransferase family 4 protein [Alteromonas sp. 009811495]|uniref:glycosyltransferase family 4 protein n=1 Tax=Alteromonas sp. 009811495 TaxID=3002962 RepID=UPI00237E61CA|nr:glycosyltransferase family 4 protein [Alteromonas sp. 009811495]WDT87692.1 glycosyltransferase family 4 protein [Alteromonas sp. 009811495]
MKICAIGLRGIPDVMGGIESHCQQLYPKMVKNGADVTVIARSPYVEGKKYEYQGVKVISLWAIQHTLLETFVHTFFAILYARIFVRPDIVHLHAIGPALFSPLARLLGMKVMVTHHGADYNRQKWSPFAKKVLKFGEKMAVTFANRVLVVGRTLTSALREEYPSYAEKISFVPNGMLPRFTGEISSNHLPSELELTPQHYILTVGRLVPEKGFHDLVDAFVQSNSELKLVIVGDTDHHSTYSNKLREAATDNVIFANRRGGDELKALYQHAKVFVLPSYHEGLPIVALEAISAGCPVLLSDISPNIDIEAPKDCYFPVGNVYELSKKLSGLNELNLTLNRSDYLEKYDWESISNVTFGYVDGLKA